MTAGRAARSVGEMRDKNMKERPLIMSGPMVKAVLAGKTHTRRVIKPQPPSWIDTFGYSIFTPAGKISGSGVHPNLGPSEKFFKCPFGQPGDKLYVRETLKESSIGSDHPRVAGYAASLPINDRPDLRFYPDAIVKKDGKMVDWWDVVKRKRDDIKPSLTLPSIFMPRWASRIILEITGIWVERVQEISISDIDAEGYPYAPKKRTAEQLGPVGVIWFQKLWDSLNAKRGFGWEQNPWVWIIEFRKTQHLTPPGESSDL